MNEIKKLEATYEKQLKRIDQLVELQGHDNPSTNAARRIAFVLADEIFAVKNGVEFDLFASAARARAQFPSIRVSK